MATIMKSRIGLIALVSVVLIGTGVGLRFMGRRALKVSFASNLSTAQATYNGQPVDMSTPHPQSADFQDADNLQLKIENAKVELIPSDRFRLEACYYGELYTLNYEQKDGVISIWDTRDRKFDNRNRGFFFGSSGLMMHGEIPTNTIKLSYPAGKRFQSVVIDNSYGDLLLGAIQASRIDFKASYGDVSSKGLQADEGEIKMSSGDGIFENLDVKRLEIRDEYGDLTIKGITGQEMESLTLKLSSGDLEMDTLNIQTLDVKDEYGGIDLDNVTAGTANIQLSSGDLDMRNVTAQQMDIDNEYGDIEARDFKSGALSVKLSSGDCTIKGSIDGDAEIESEYGGASLTLAERRESYNLRLNTDYGKIRVDGERIVNEDGEDEKSLEEDNKAQRRLGIACDSGDINVTFSK